MPLGHPIRLIIVFPWVYPNSIAMSNSVDTIFLLISAVATSFLPNWLQE